MAKKISDKAYYEKWQEFRKNIDKATPVDLDESQGDKAKRIKRLEGNNEEWYKYYFPNFYLSEPAPFHKPSTKCVMENAEFFLVRAWCRELAKSARTMMDVLKLTVTGKKKNVILVSATSTDAERLLLPYKSILESNNRIINDYGKQESVGSWTASEFITKKGVAFRALGAGQSPRGTRNEAVRPDVILIDDIDTDEEVRNKKRIKAKVDWVLEALYATRSISNPLLLMAVGNIIGKYTTITELGKKADRYEIVNIRDKKGKSTWPQKNTEEMIDRVLKPMSYRNQQKEYFNNPLKEGTVFKEIKYGKCPPIHKCEKVLFYADPSTSNKDKSGGNASAKCVIVVGYKNFMYFVYWIRLDQTGNSRFVDWLYDANDYLMEHNVQIRRGWIENNSLQDAFYEQVIDPEIKKRAKRRKTRLPLSLDNRNKPDKFYRIEGTLDPIHRSGDLIFDQKLKGTPDMERMEDQMLDVDVASKTMDGPDALEGCVFKLQENSATEETTHIVGKRISFKN
ncbi:hypothetical protein [Brumimicrobium mesophilum]|uniref:hypothetical protein n=1 Tax=Brumimicrobium mesophilum TaxID=392717 RepID=UPI000D142A17|nr:hypothetical protein [Brumimicrobium mesophilum]